MLAAQTSPLLALALLASSLSGCADDAPDTMDPVAPLSQTSSAGTSGSAGAMPPDPTCVDGQWRLAPGFRLSRRVDYIADRMSVPTALMGNVETAKPQLLSSAGTPCATAKNRATCESALELETQFGRHLVTTWGDEVKLWGPLQSRAVLGSADTKAEALWWLETTTGYVAPCDAKVTEQDDGYLIEGIVTSGACLMDPPDPNLLPPEPRGSASVDPEGTVMVLTVPSVGNFPVCMPPPPRPLPF